MTRCLAPLFSLLLATLSVQAGGFGGPPPFTNGSPLTSGVDGSYQANVRAKNTTGVIRFAYSDGIQTTSTTSNSFAIFLEGIVFTGTTTASITTSSLAGVLQYSDSTFATTSRMTGEFNGKFNTKSPSYAFKGDGRLQPFFSTPTAPTIFLAGVPTDFKFTGVRNSQSTN